MLWGETEDEPRSAPVAAHGRRLEEEREQITGQLQQACERAAPPRARGWSERAPAASELRVAMRRAGRARGSVRLTDKPRRRCGVTARAPRSSSLAGAAYAKPTLQRIERRTLRTRNGRISTSNARRVQQRDREGEPVRPQLRPLEDFGRPARAAAQAARRLRLSQLARLARALPRAPAARDRPARGRSGRGVLHQAGRDRLGRRGDVQAAHATRARARRADRRGEGRAAARVA